MLVRMEIQIPEEKKIPNTPCATATEPAMRRQWNTYAADICTLRVWYPLPLVDGSRFCVIRHPLATYCTNRNGNMKPYMPEQYPIIDEYLKTPEPLSTMRSSIK